ncbi:Carnitine monooxygenase oxygenase subunit [Paraconexibacter sp. AEG42_29]|uniref:Carnitine monooxygenase oxygenase subunit n=1 Tax=Paraconexibacter sp. AEG42_29 TaxID=2997339 RepID=A0AAU7APE4_9ACTN
MHKLEDVPALELRKLVDHLQRSWTDQVDDHLQVDPRIYHDPEVARLERERVFGRAPIAVVHSSELAEPGAFRTVRLPNNEALLIRQKDGSIRAFVNACRHRGALLEEREEGTCVRSRVQCPYHGWSYNIDGSLKSPTHQVSFGEFDQIAAGLVRLPAEERHGFVWVVDRAGAPIDVAGWLGPQMDAILGSYGIETHVCFKYGAFFENANWKVLQDAFLDGYHIQFVHAETAAKMTYTNVLTLEDYARHTRFLSPRKSLGRLLEDRDADDLGDEEIRSNVNISHGLLPNSTLLYLPQPDHFQLLSFFPDPKNTARSRMELRLIVPRVEDSGWEAEKWERIWGKNWKINMDILRDEDFPIARNAQRALESADAGPLTIGRNEVANSVFHRELTRLMQTPLGEEPAR